MTAAVPDSFRDQLAGLLLSHRRIDAPEGEIACACGWRGPWFSRHQAEVSESFVADELRARVEAAGRKRAAEELDLAAVLTVPSQDTPEEIREALFRRADTLRATPPTPEGTP